MPGGASAVELPRLIVALQELQANIWDAWVIAKREPKQGFPHPPGEFKAEAFPLLPFLTPHPESRAKVWR